MGQRNVLLIFIVFICVLFAYIDITRSCGRRGAGQGGAGEEVQDHSATASIR